MTVEELSEDRRGVLEALPSGRMALRIIDRQTAELDAARKLIDAMESGGQDQLRQLADLRRRATEALRYCADTMLGAGALAECVEEALRGR